MREDYETDAICVTGKLSSFGPVYFTQQPDDVYVAFQALKPGFALLKDRLFVLMNAFLTYLFWSLGLDKTRESWQERMCSKTFRNIENF